MDRMDTGIYKMQIDKKYNANEIADLFGYKSKQSIYDIKRRVERRK